MANPDPSFESKTLAFSACFAAFSAAANSAAACLSASSWSLFFLFFPLAKSSADKSDERAEINMSMAGGGSCNILSTSSSPTCGMPFDSGSCDTTEPIIIKLAMSFILCFLLCSLFFLSLSSITLHHSTNYCITTMELLAFICRKRGVN